jgi:type 2 lantibiotic biosynthesis protein LanM
MTTLPPTVPRATTVRLESSARPEHVLSNHLPWWLAASLPERLGADPTVLNVDDQRGRRRVKQWGELPGFSGDPNTMNDRLTVLGVDSQELTVLLGETEPSLARRLPEPEWHRRFWGWWHIGAADVSHSAAEELGEIDLLEIARPLLRGASHELSAAIRKRLAGAVDPVLADVDHIVKTMTATLPLGDLTDMVNRTMVLELNVARVQGQLDSETPRERFDQYVTGLRDPTVALALWREYVVLARLMVENLDFWVESRCQFVDALIADLPHLRERLLPPETSRLVRVEFGAGDRHRRGRSVAMVHLDTSRVVFKPRSLAMDVVFDEVLAWINRQGLENALARLTVIDCGTHGWVEAVDIDERTDDAGGDRFAWRLGSLAATLHVLHAADFHHENVLASGEHPVLVDLEALLHTDKTGAVVQVGESHDPASRKLAESVQAVGLIPNRLLVRGQDGTFGIDVSAMGGKGGQITPVPVPRWEGNYTDEMHLVRERVAMDGASNHPLDDHGNSLDLLSRASFFRRGFVSAYRVLAKATSADPVPIHGFGRCLSRHIARPTHLYFRTLQDATHPDFLRDALDRERALARLSAGLDTVPHRDAMMACELAELRQSDIPVFLVEVDSGVLCGGPGLEPIGRSDVSPLVKAHERLSGLSEEDLAFQAGVIDSSIAAVRMGADSAGWPNWHRSRRARGVSGEAFAEAALVVAERLAERAVVDGPRVGWIGMELVDEAYWQVTPAPLGLYTGVAGIGHALDAVASVTADSAIDRLAVRTLDHVAERVNMLSEKLADIELKPGQSEFGAGVFGGFGGPIYALAHAGARRKRADYLDAALGLVPALERLLIDDPFLDVVSGAAGAVFACLSVEAAAPGRGALAVAQHAGERLLRTRREMPTGWAWPTAISPDQPLGGFSHGVSGIAAAFARLHRRSPDPRYVDAATRALDYESTLFEPTHGTWRDLRPESVGSRSRMSAWCHGAPGVALGRIEVLQNLPDPDGRATSWDRDRAIAIRTAMATGLDQDPVTGMGNHSLCHGDIGNLTIIGAAARSDGDEHILALLPTAWSTLLEEAGENGWLCGVPEGLETPGLMTGLAGIAWGLAHQADPAAVPDILRLAEPVTGDAAWTR